MKPVHDRDDPIAGSTDRVVYGLRIASEIPAPDMLPWTGGDRPADLTIRLGSVPARIDDVIVERPLLQIGTDGTCRYEIPAVAAYHVSPDGADIVVAPHAAGTVRPDMAEVRTFLFGTVLAIACMKRGLLPLHASCLRFGDRAIAFVGHSGAGKSTLAATLLQRGYPLLADDVTMIEPNAPGGPLVLPGFPRVKLWHDALDRLSLSSTGLERARPSLEKYHVPVESAFCARPMPLAGIVHLEGPTRAPAGLRPVRAIDALKLISTVLYRQQLMLRLGLRDRQMADYGRLLGAVGGIQALRRFESIAELDAVLPSLIALAA